MSTSIPTYRGLVLKKPVYDCKGVEKEPAEIVGTIDEFVAADANAARALAISKLYAADEKFKAVFENILAYEVRLETRGDHITVF